MLSFKLDFEIDEGHINTFLIGSKSLFEKIDAIALLIAGSIDVEIDVKYKLVELESTHILYNLLVDLSYPIQPVFGYNISKEQIDDWFRHGLTLLLNKRDREESIYSFSTFAKKTGLDLYFIYVEIPENILMKLLDDFEKMSILLFKKLVFLEN